MTARKVGYLSVAVWVVVKEARLVFAMGLLLVVRLVVQMVLQLVDMMVVLSAVLMVALKDNNSVVAMVY